jgi:hypothetical protein
MSDRWLADIVVLNESRDEATAGDVSVYRSVGAACGALEHWWVENGEGFAFTASGDRLVLGVNGGNTVVVASQEAVPDGAQIVLGWLRDYAAALLEARRAKALKGKVVLSRSEEIGELPSSVEGLIAYVGFDC